MKKMNRRLACGLLAVSLATAGLAGCGDKLDGTQIAATVDGQDVTLGLASYMARDYQAQMESFYQMMAQSYGMGSAGDIWSSEAEEGKTIGEASRDDIMQQIQIMHLIRDHAEEYGVALTEEDTKKIQETAKTFMEENTEDVLAELAVSQADIEEYLELMTYQFKMRDPMVADVDQTVSDEEVNQSTVTLVKVSTAGTVQDEQGSIIELTEEEKAAKKELAQQVLDKVAAAGAQADMDALAKEVDASLTAAVQSFTTAGSEEDFLDENVIAAAKALTDGQTAQEVVEGADGYYVVRLDAALDEEATKRKGDSIIEGRKSEFYDSLIEEWKKDSELKVVDEVWDQIQITDDKSFQYKPAEPAEPSETPEEKPELSEEEPEKSAEE